MRIGIDLGGTKTEIVALGDGGHELYRKRVYTPAASYDDIVATLADLVHEAEAALGQHLRPQSHRTAQAQRLARLELVRIELAMRAIPRALAQAAALLAFDTLGQTPDDNTVYYFAGIDGARFKRPVEPGDQLTLEVALDRMKAGIFKFKARALVGD